MIEGIISVLGLCITFLPVIMLCNYLLTHVNRMTGFDYHKELVKDKKGKLGVCIAYVERGSFGLLICLLGILMSDFFRNEFIFRLFVLVLIVYIIVKYFDEKNEK